MKLGVASGSSFAPLSGMTLADARRELATLRLRRAELDARILEVVSHIERLAIADRPEVALTHRELVEHAGLTSREAHATVARAEVTEAEPAFGKLLASGVASTGHLDAVARAFTTLGAERHKLDTQLPDLAQAAATMPVGEFAKMVNTAARALLDDGGLSEFERQRRSTFLKASIDTDGGVRLAGYFDPERGAALLSAIEQRREQAFHSADSHVDVMPWIEPNEHRNALALLDLTLTASGSSSDGTAAPRAEVVVHIDLNTLRNGLHTHTVSRTAYGSDLPAATVRRLACEAHIIPVVLSGDSVPLDVGRSRRLATANQRRALEAVHSTCAIPDCTKPFHHCQIHHIDYWESGGPTDLDNMVPLCSEHHHQAHEGGYTLMLEPITRTVTFSPPSTPPRAFTTTRITA